MAALAGGVVWLALFVVFVVLVRRNPRRRPDDAAPVAGVTEPVVLGVGVAAFLVGVAALLLLVKQLVPG